MARYITMLEVSQKQAYIFESNKVKDNILNSAIIAYVLSPEYIMQCLCSEGYQENNLVYSGGGHTVLEFSDFEQAKRMTKILTESIYRTFDGLCVFAKTIPYDENIGDGKVHVPSENLKLLTRRLEQKKSVRTSSFHQGSYGIEAINSNTLKPKAELSDKETRRKIEQMEHGLTSRDFCPDGYKPVYEFGKLGGSKGESNFISVIHIDGNGMGKRVEELYRQLKDENADWEHTKSALQQFSDNIDKAFKNAYKEMVHEVGALLQKGLDKQINLTDTNFPIRRIITAGDDICFVAEGRIGIECARIYIEKLKEQPSDGAPYTACAGVAIIHCKYPFYKAYELAEMLCSNAKSYGAEISPEDNGRCISSIDWHIEFGEIADSLKEIRSQYHSYDGKALEMRPYIIDGPEKMMKDEKYSVKLYDNFKSTIESILRNEEEIGIGKIKGLRSAVKRGEAELEYYLTFNQINFNINRQMHSLLFDAVELMDTYISLS